MSFDKSFSSLEVYISFVRDAIASEVLTSVNDTDLIRRMIAYHMGLDASNSNEHITGKHIRPLLTLLCADGSGGSWRLAKSLSVAVELVHNFSLIHDDIQDESILRRGRDTVWHKWGAAQAINAGDALFALSHLIIAKDENLSVQCRLEALHIIDDACLSLTSGQTLDLEFEDLDSISIEQYLNMIGGKTGALIGAATELGALFSGVSKEHQRNYREFGYQLGIAYQVRDDMLGIWGEVEKTGKMVGDDFHSRKKTLPIVMGLERSDKLRRMYNQANSDHLVFEDVVQILEETDVVEDIKHFEFNEVEKTLSKLSNACPRGYAGQALDDLVRNLLGRSY